MDQRFIELAFTQSSTTSFVQAPDTADEAPPGYYLLFVIDDVGVPSVARIVRVNIAGQSQPTDETPTIGGSGGAPFNISCDAGEALVGMFGLANSNGRQARWNPLRADRLRSPLDRRPGRPRQRGWFDGTCLHEDLSTGLCDRRLQGTGIRRVDQLDFECRALDPSGLRWVMGSSWDRSGARRVPRRDHTAAGPRIPVTRWRGARRKDRRNQRPMPTGPELRAA